MTPMRARVPSDPGKGGGRSLLVMGPQYWSRWAGRLQLVQGQRWVNMGGGRGVPRTDQDMD